MIDVLLLLALPASGKSEVRRYLEHLDPGTVVSDMHLGPTVQLDDYPYVHLMRRVSQELNGLGADPIFFDDDLSPWNDPYDWLTLIHLVNEDFARLGSGNVPDPTAGSLLDRFDRTRTLAGTDAPFGDLDPATRSALEDAIAADAADLAAGLPLDRPAGTTVVIEFARGGPDGADLPLPHPLGYRASVAALDDEILERASILYVWVEPEESRRRNRERARPGREGDASILHHGVPESVMFGDYGTDDVAWLESRARRPGTIPIGDHDIPFARFDNRDDLTSFLRADPTEWDPADVARVHEGLSGALGSLDVA
jgi:hypothetical protein